MVSIRVNDRPLDVKEGLPLGASLYEAGIYSFEGSFKLGRPRGPMSFEWWSPERIYVEGYGPVSHMMKCTDGLKIKTSDGGIKRPFIEAISPLLKVGFQHGYIFRNKIGWRVTWSFMKRTLPHPDIPSEVERKEFPSPIEVETDVLVVGGGLYGLLAAISARKTGARVVLFEGNEDVGGHIFHDERVKKLAKEAEEAGVKIMRETALSAVFEDALVAVQLKEPDAVPILVRARSIVIATGAREVLSVFGNNDLPGVMLGTSALRLFKLYGVKPGRRGVVIGSSKWAVEIARTLSSSGMDVVLVHDKEVEVEGVNAVKARVIEALGRRKVEGVKLDDGSVVKADFIALANVRAPSMEIAAQFGVKIGFHSGLGGFVPLHGWEGETSVEGVFITGEAGGVDEDEALVHFSKAAGLSAAKYAGFNAPDIDDEISEGRKASRKMGELVDGYKKGELCVFDDDMGLMQNPEHKRSFLCPCLDVTTYDVKKIVKELGWTKMEKIKRYSGLGTGRCQGKYCLLPSVVYISRIGNVRPVDVGTFRMRPPLAPIQLGVLGGMDR
ncbi:FAD-dependent oxidoreductase [Candidatus Methanodesulfokora washburnensis]|uniref:FAD-dependent oxidoreductase n=1 Tax=Candidatus Methanodesulfokora washburnensis TaxID=2478471 RepID=A0A3R9PC61_9CREN|nr:FAD-dependent oxidoreductase [Candidatus Methanodesulfokores washburnensis]RSN72327.1 FAD-dependent oxidoreductase [Candidatus Methanodesulfokores washburnensis]